MFVGRLAAFNSLFAPIHLLFYFRPPYRATTRKQNGMNISQASIEQLSIHLVGNKVNETAPQLSNRSLELNEELKAVLNDYFVQPFTKVHGFEQFTHPSNLQYNTCYTILQQMFTDGNDFHHSSVELANYLFDRSAHPLIKKGEFYVVYFKDIIFENQNLDAVGLFKSETKEKFIRVQQQQQLFDLEVEEGINIHKLDKGALIFNDAVEDGFRVLSIDHTNKSNEARYWLHDFLGLRPASDSYHTTQNFLTLTKQYITDAMKEDFQVSRADQADYLNRSVDYFKSQEQFNETDFATEVFGHDTVIDSFNKFKDGYIREKELDIATDFTISPNAVKKQARVFKSVLKLDRNFHIYIHGDKSLIEQGYDERTGKKYYKIYFDEES